MVTATKAVATVSKEISQAELNALLQGAGFASAPGERQERISLKGQIFTTSDNNEMFIYNPKKPQEPAFTVRILKPVQEYNAIWIDDAIAQQFGRPDLAGTFSKKFYQPDPDRHVWPSDEAYDELYRNIGDFTDKDGKPMKAAWKGDLFVQIVPEDGQMTGNETTYLMTLPTTALIEFRGTSKAPEAGVASEFNFMQKLVRFAVEQAPEGTEPSTAVLDALTAYASGDVVAEVRVGNVDNKTMGQSWTIPVFDPIFIAPAAPKAPALGDGENPDEVGL